MATITVNGVRHEVQAKDDTPLLYVLRNELQLSGPQFGCGLAQCGACSVLIDGKETRSCVTPISSVIGESGNHHARRPTRALGKAKRSFSRSGQRHSSPRSAGMDCRTNSPLWLLPERHDDRRHRTPRNKSQSQRRTDQGCLHHRRAIAAPLSLRQLCRNYRRR